MELNTFGALLRLGLDLERQAGDIYRNLSKDGQAAPKELFKKYAQEHIRRFRLLEEVRQQNINEVLLEPISGMNSKTYTLTTTIAEATNIATDLNTAINIEDKIRMFYDHSLKTAGKSLGEVGRTFRRFSEENIERKKILLLLLNAPNR